MLRITVPANELYDERTNTFISIKETTLQLEHSLVSLSKWESKWHKAFLSSREKTHEEVVDYIKCMTITQNVNPIVYSCLTKENIEEINKYISDPMTATYFMDSDKSGFHGEVVTAELIYYWMITFNIPSEYQKWHLNRLIALIKVCNMKNQPAKKMSKSEIMKRNAALNAQRRAKMNSKG